MKIRNFILLALFALTLNVHAQDYKAAVGLRLAWGWGLTGKFFMDDHAAIEGILNYRNYSYFYNTNDYGYNYLRITGLYELHSDLSATAQGLTWYYGGGAFVGFYGGHFTNYYTGTKSATYIGIAGCLGLDYKFKDTPINLSVDWIPSFVLTGYGDGFTGENGGIAIRYVFK